MHWLGRVVGLVLAAILCGVAPSCLATSPGQSEVAQGRLYQSGEPLYDEFFLQLHAAQVVAEQAPQGEADVRRALGAALGLGALTVSAGAAGGAGDQEATVAQGGAAPMQSSPAVAANFDEAAPPETLAAEVERRVAGVKWRAQLRLDVEGELGDEGAKARLQWIGKPRSAEQQLGDSLETALDEELQILAQMRGHRQELERLGAMAQGLEKNVDSVFRRAGLAKRAEVKKNIRDAQALIPLMDGRVQEVASTAEQMVRKLRSAATTAEEQAEPSPPAPAPPSATPAAPTRPAARPAAPARPTAPKRPAAPAGDFEP
jgi:hypothetical protein